MSRARDWQNPVTGSVHWFDAHGIPSVRELEVLADAEGLDIDDVLDAQLSSKEVLFRLNKLTDKIPEAGLNRVKRRQEQGEPAVCAICSIEGWECEGRLTKHHFVPRWIMLELSEYEVYAPRNICTTPICLGAHKFLHKRYGNGGTKSIAKYLDDTQKALVHELVTMLRQERPKIYALLAHGDTSSYEGQLIRDFRRGLFDVCGEGKADPFPRWKLRKPLESDG